MRELLMRFISLVLSAAFIITNGGVNIFAQVYGGIDFGKVERDITVARQDKTRIEKGVVKFKPEAKRFTPESEEVYKLLMETDSSLKTFQANILINYLRNKDVPEAEKAALSGGIVNALFYYDGDGQGITESLIKEFSTEKYKVKKIDVTTELLSRTTEFVFDDIPDLITYGERKPNRRDKGMAGICAAAAGGYDGGYDNNGKLEDGRTTLAAALVTAYAEVYYPNYASPKFLLELSRSDTHRLVRHAALTGLSKSNLDGAYKNEKAYVEGSLAAMYFCDEAIADGIPPRSEYGQILRNETAYAYARLTNGSEEYANQGVMVGSHGDAVIKAEPVVKPEDLTLSERFFRALGEENPLKVYITAYMTASVVAQGGQAIGDGVKYFKEARAAQATAAELAQSAMTELKTPIGTKPGVPVKISKVSMTNGEILDVTFKPAGQSGRIWDEKLGKWINITGDEEYLGGVTNPTGPMGGPGTATAVRVSSRPKVPTIQITPNAKVIFPQITIRNTAVPSIGEDLKTAEVIPQTTIKTITNTSTAAPAAPASYALPKAVSPLPYAAVPLTKSNFGENFQKSERPIVIPTLMPTTVELETLLQQAERGYISWELIKNRAFLNKKQRERLEAVLRRTGVENITVITDNIAAAADNAVTKIKELMKKPAWKSYPAFLKLALMEDAAGIFTPYPDLYFMADGNYPGTTNESQLLALQIIVKNQASTIAGKTLLEGLKIYNEKGMLLRNTALYDELYKLASGKEPYTVSLAQERTEAAVLLTGLMPKGQEDRYLGDIAAGTYWTADMGTDKIAGIINQTLKMKENESQKNMWFPDNLLQGKTPYEQQAIVNGIIANFKAEKEDFLNHVKLTPGMLRGIWESRGDAVKQDKAFGLKVIYAWNKGNFFRLNDLYVTLHGQTIKIPVLELEKSMGAAGYENLNNYAVNIMKDFLKGSPAPRIRRNRFGVIASYVKDRTVNSIFFVIGPHEIKSAPQHFHLKITSYDINKSYGVTLNYTYELHNRANGNARIILSDGQSLQFQKFTPEIANNILDDIQKRLTEEVNNRSAAKASNAPAAAPQAAKPEAEQKLITPVASVTAESNPAAPTANVDNGAGQISYAESVPVKDTEQQENASSDSRRQRLNTEMENARNGVISRYLIDNKAYLTKEEHKEIYDIITNKIKKAAGKEPSYSIWDEKPIYNLTTFNLLMEELKWLQDHDGRYMDTSPKKKEELAFYNRVNARILYGIKTGKIDKDPALQVLRDIKEANRKQIQAPDKSSRELLKIVKDFMAANPGKFIPASSEYYDIIEARVNRATEENIKKDSALRELVQIWKANIKEPLLTSEEFLQKLKTWMAAHPGKFMSPSSEDYEEVRLYENLCRRVMYATEERIKKEPGLKELVEIWKANTKQSSIKPAEAQAPAPLPAAGQNNVSQTLNGAGDAATAEKEVAKNPGTEKAPSWMELHTALQDAEQGLGDINYLIANKWRYSAQEQAILDKILKDGLEQTRRNYVTNFEMSKKSEFEKNNPKEWEKLNALLSSEPHYQKWPYDRWHHVGGVIDVDMGNAFVADNTMPVRFLRTDAIADCIGLVITAKHNDTVLNTGLAHVHGFENFKSLLEEGFLTKVRGDGLKVNKFEISMTASMSNKEFAVKVLHEIIKYAKKENITVTVSADLFRYPNVAVDIKTGLLYVDTAQLPYYLRDNFPTAAPAPAPLPAASVTAEPKDLQINTNAPAGKSPFNTKPLLDAPPARKGRFLGEELEEYLRQIGVKANEPLSYTYKLPQGVTEQNIENLFGLSSSRASRNEILGRNITAYEKEFVEEIFRLNPEIRQYFNTGVDFIDKLPVTDRISNSAYLENFIIGVASRFHPRDIVYFMELNGFNHRVMTDKSRELADKQWQGLTKALGRDISGFRPDPRVFTDVKISRSPEYLQKIQDRLAEINKALEGKNVSAAVKQIHQQIQQWQSDIEKGLTSDISKQQLAAQISPLTAEEKEIISLLNERSFIEEKNWLPVGGEKVFNSDWGIYTFEVYRRP
ncbi:MAG: hypothetical protein FWF35_04815 [Elusimicrobia bacterium]|nr:hypothetical protein [Elusimicrobiota bacterium]